MRRFALPMCLAIRWASSSPWPGAEPRSDGRAADVDRTRLHPAGLSTVSATHSSSKLSRYAYASCSESITRRRSPDGATTPRSSSSSRSGPCARRGRRTCGASGRPASRHAWVGKRSAASSSGSVRGGAGSGSRPCVLLLDHDPDLDAAPAAAPEGVAAARLDLRREVDVVDRGEQRLPSAVEEADQRVRDLVAGSCAPSRRVRTSIIASSLRERPGRPGRPRAGRVG